MTVLRERERESAALEGLLSAAERGIGGAVLLRAPPGLGKSALIAQAARSASARSFVVSRARASELEAGWAFGVAQQLLEALPASCEGRAIALSASGALAARLLDASSPTAAAPDPSFAVMQALYREGETILVPPQTK